MSAEVTDGSPAWFTRALRTPGEHDEIVVDGTRIAYRAWGEPGAPGLVLVHGGAAHSGWWDHIAPSFAQTRRIVAPDLSGHGDSDWRDTYRITAWAEEVLAVMQAARADATPVVVGHSLGGLVSIRAAISRPDLVRDLMLVDTRIVDAETFAALTQTAQAARIPRQTRLYPTKAAGLARYRLVPEGDSLDYVRDHVGEQSLVRDDRGWRWKFDRGFADELTDLPGRPPAGCRMTVVHGEHGVMTATMAQHVTGHLDEPARVVEFAGAGHHIPLERPLELIDMIDDALRRQTHDGGAGGDLSQS